MKPALQMALSAAWLAGRGGKAPATPPPPQTAQQGFRDLAAQPLLLNSSLSAVTGSPTQASSINTYTRQLLLTQTACQIGAGLEAGYEFFGGSRGFVEPVDWPAYASSVDARLAVVQATDAEIESAQRKGEALRQLLATETVAAAVKEARSAVIYELVSGFNRALGRLSDIGTQVAWSRSALQVTRTEDWSVPAYISESLLKNETNSGMQHATLE